MENLVGSFEWLKEIYAGKKVLLTGHTGFKGSWMLKLLNMLGASVQGYALEPDLGDMYNLIDGDSLCSSRIGDLRNRSLLAREVTNFEPDYVFHLAAQPLVRLSYEIPAETFEVNGIGTANLLDAIRLLKKKCTVVLITTDKVYHNNEWLYPYRETDRLGGYDPYSASKACSELIIDSYKNSFFNPEDYNNHGKGISIGRAGNVIGGGDWAKDRLIPDIVRALSVEEEINVRNPMAVRPWQHVLEPVLGYLILGGKLSLDPIRYGGAYNFGPNAADTLSVEQMLDLAIKAWGHGNYVISPSNHPLHEAGLLRLDISKAISELQWHPKWDAAQAVEMTIEWYKLYFERSNNIREFTEQQIMNFING